MLILNGLFRKEKHSITHIINITETLAVLLLYLNAAECQLNLLLRMLY